MLTGGSLGSHSHASGPPRYPPDPRRASHGFFDRQADAWEIAPMRVRMILQEAQLTVAS